MPEGVRVTDNWRELLIGINMSGLGTPVASPVASPASVITFNLYVKKAGSRPFRHLVVL